MLVDKDGFCTRCQAAAGTCNHVVYACLFCGEARGQGKCKAKCRPDWVKPEGRDEARMLHQQHEGRSARVEVLPQDQWPSGRRARGEPVNHWQQHDERPAGGGAPFDVSPLGDLVRDGVPPPDLLPGDLLYAGGVHLVSGEPDCGKTTMVLWQALMLMRDGQRVAFLDEEGGEEMTAEKFIALGASPDDMGQLDYIPFPARAWTPKDIKALRDMHADNGYAMIIFDSCAAFMARAGLDENSAADVTRWWSDILIPLARAEAAVVVIDHDTKAKGEGSRFSRGSGAKLAASDVMIKVELVSPFSRDTNGALKLLITKDRRGWLHRAHDVVVHTGDGLIKLAVTEAAGGAAQSGADSMLTKAEQKLHEALTATPSTRRQIVDRIAEAHGHGLTDKTVRAGLHRLAELGMAEQLPGDPGRADFWQVRDPGTPVVNDHL